MVEINGGDAGGDVGGDAPSCVRTGVAIIVKGKVGRVNGVATPVGGGVAGQN